MIMKIRNLKGFTLAELLLAIAIISILSAVSFVNVTSHMRSMKQLELDGYAKEIFIAAQNHLIMAESNGYYGRSTASYFGTPEDPADTIYYFVSPYKVDADLKDTLLYRMVPPGSIDVGNVNYIIRYDLNTGRVLDVFCTEKEGTYGLDLQGKYDELLKLIKEKGDRSNYGTNKSVIGYYGGGGTAPISIKPDYYKAPEVTIVNGDELTATVKVEDINPSSLDKIEILLYIEGIRSKTIQEVSLYLYKDGELKSEADYYNYDSAKKELVLVKELDSIKDSLGKHFGEQFTDFFPGEDISLQALIFDTDKVSNIAYGNKEITNSLYGNYTEIDSEDDIVTASIENLRHLENLSNNVSNVHNDKSPLAVKKANQVKDINMDGSGFEDGGVIEFNGETGSTGLRPVYTGKKLVYEGNNFKLENIDIETDEDAGIFGKLESESIVTNLQIINPSINGNENVGALVGKLESGSKVTNIHIINPSINGNNNVGGLVGESISSELSGVYVYEKDGSSTIVSDDGTAGGLAGKMNGGSITGCFASVLVEAKDNAGGLIGEADASSVKASYSGGHTEGGEYPTEIAAGSWFNKKANIKAENGNAGGLIGNADSSTVQYCYSTCSASGSVAGGFVGSDSESTIENCYCTGLVNGSKTNNVNNFGGFSGTGSASYYSNDRYLETVVYDYDNPMNATGGSYSGNGIRPMDPDTDKLTKDWESEYADFTNYDKGAASDAFPYDTALGGYYHHTDDDNVNHFKYPFKTIMGNPDYKLFTEDLPNVITDPAMLKTHHGDWPMADTIVINISN